MIPLGTLPTIPVPIVRAHRIEVTADEMEEMSRLAGIPINLPGNCAGWAYLDLPGGRYRAFVAAPGGGES